MVASCSIENGASQRWRFLCFLKGGEMIMNYYDYKLSEKVIAKAIRDFDYSERYKEVVLTKLFEKYPNNTDYYEILIKVTVLNSLYSAGLNNNKGKKTIDVVTMAKHILLEPRIDIWLKQDDEEVLFNAYRYIAEEESCVRNKEYSKCYAFASKYCSWHRPEVFPIMDSKAKKNLYQFIINNDISVSSKSKVLTKLEKDDFHDYKIFWDLCKEFKEFIESSYEREKEYNMKDIDKLLWQYGRETNENDILQKEEIEGKEGGKG